MSDGDGGPSRAPSLVAGGAAAIAGPALVVAGLIPPVAGVLVAGGLFAGAAAAVNALRNRHHEQEQAEAAALVPPKPDPIQALAQFEASIAGDVPAAVQARVARIATTIRETLPRLDQLGAMSPQAHTVVQTAASYLPEAVAAYQRLPRDYADRRPVSGGKTSLMILCDQLDLLGNKMDEIFDAVVQSDVDALLAHGRFLADKFGHGDLAVDTGAP